MSPALVTALRGMLAVTVPVVVLQLAGYPGASLIAGIGGLQTSIADAGGPYRERLRAMGLCALLGPLALWIGSQLHALWWLAGAAMFAIAAAGGLARALGPTGQSLGLILGVAFLVGMNTPTPPVQGAIHAGFYLAGAGWTIAIVLVLWQLRPYKRLEAEVGEALQAVARLLATIRLRGARGRRLRERDLRRRERSVREAIERARYTLGHSRESTIGADPVMGQLLILLRTASRLTFTAVRLHGLRLPPGSPPESHAALAAAMKALESAIWRSALMLRSGHTRKGDVTRLRGRIDNLRRIDSGVPAWRALRDHAAAVLEVGAQHLENAEEALQELFGHKPRARRSLLPPLTVGDRPAPAWARMRSHLTLRSILCRHALRVGTAAAVATALFSALRLPHGIWLPLTILVVLQPDFGATLSRALLRTAGTLAGVLLAGLLLLAQPNLMAVDMLVALLSFCAFLAFRRNYALFVFCVTPLVVLLLDLLEPATRALVAYRAADTVAGAALALTAGYLLWPRWTHNQLPEQIARSLRAHAVYLRHTLAAAAEGNPLDTDILEARREAEIQAGNADATFERMLAEPRHRRRATERYFTMVTYLQRLSRHLGTFAGHLETDSGPAPELGRLITPLGAMLEESAREITRESVGTTALTPELRDEALSGLRARDQRQGADLARLTSTIISDINGLRDAVRHPG